MVSHVIDATSCLDACGLLHHTLRVNLVTAKFGQAARSLRPRRGDRSRAFDGVGVRTFQRRLDFRCVLPLPGQCSCSCAKAVIRSESYSMQQMPLQSVQSMYPTLTIPVVCEQAIIARCACQAVQLRCDSLG